MKIAIIGEKSRAKAWEKHLRQLATVQEVIISPSLINDPVDTCILIDDTPKKLHLLHDAIRSGHHSYLVSQLPLDTEMIEKIYHTSEEAKVHVQFSHWPSHSPSTQWIKQQIEKPEITQIKKDLTSESYSNSNRAFEQHWMDEIAFIIKFHSTGVQSIIAKPVRSSDYWTGLQVVIQFDDGSVADLQFSTVAKNDHHQRLTSSGKVIIDTDVNKQKARKITINQNGRVEVSEKSFDASETAELSVQNFIKAIQLNKKSEFSAYDALQTVRIYNKIVSHLNRFR